VYFITQDLKVSSSVARCVDLTAVPDPEERRPARWLDSTRSTQWF